VERALTTAWFDEQSRMSPDELRTVTFPTSRGRRGYDEESVQEYLRSVHAEFVRLVNERRSLWQELQRLRRRVIFGQPKGDPDGGAAGESSAQVDALQIFAAAPVASDDVADAQASGARLAQDGRLRHDEIMQEAERYSDMVLDEAHARAREAAVSVLDAAPSPQTHQQQQAAQAELAYLRTCSDVYRAHLRAYTEGILRGIEDWERHEAASFEEVVRSTSMNALPMSECNGPAR
jgi:DivIVA domain-containing protein